MDLEVQIAAHTPLGRQHDRNSEPAELTRERVDRARRATAHRVSQMAGAAMATLNDFADVVMEADRAGLTMEAFGQMFDEALRETA